MGIIKLKVNDNGVNNTHYIKKSKIQGLSVVNVAGSKEYIVDLDNRGIKVDEEKYYELLEMLYKGELE